MEAGEEVGGNMKESFVVDPLPVRWTGAAPWPREAVINPYAAAKKSSFDDPWGRVTAPMSTVKTVEGLSEGENTIASPPMRGPSERGRR